MDYVVVPLGNGRLKLVSPQGEESFADLKHGVVLLPQGRRASQRHQCQRLRVRLRRDRAEELTTSFRAGGHDGTRTRCSGRESMTDKITFELDGKRGRGRGRARPSGRWRSAHGTKIPHLCWHPAPGYRADGNCRACMVEVEGERVLAASCQRKAAAGMKVKTATRAGQEIARDGVRAAAGRPARARDQPRSAVQVLELGRRHGRHAHAPLPQRRPARRRRHAFGHRRQPRRLHQLRPVRARLPRGAGQRRDRHGLSRPRLQGGVRLRQGHGRVDLRRLRRVRAGVPDRRADGEEPARHKPASASTTRPSRSTRCAPTAASAARPRCTSRTTRSSTSTAATGRPTTTGCASRAASASTTSITPTA